MSRKRKRTYEGADEEDQKKQIEDQKKQIEDQKKQIEDQKKQHTDAYAKWLAEDMHNAMEIAKLKDGRICAVQTDVENQLEIKRLTDLCQTYAKNAVRAIMHAQVLDQARMGDVGMPTCCVCMGEPVRNISIPCSHASMCTACAALCDVICPICRCEIGESYPIYM
jgi:hypothetical protein